MSYILDALRRLEKDKEIVRKGINPMEAVLIDDSYGGRKFGGSRIWWFVTVSFLLIAIIVATYFITRQLLLVPGEAQQARGVAGTSAPPHEKGYLPSPAEEKRGPEGAIENLRAGKNRGGYPAPEEDSRESPTADIFSSEKPDIPERGIQPDGMRAYQRKPLPFIPKKKAPAALEMDKQPAEERSAVPLPKTEDYRPWLGEEIKISAIAYSQEPKSRFAVVNLKTVRQGDSVAGLEIREIQEDGIVLIEGGDKYKIFLGKR